MGTIVNERIVDYINSLDKGNSPVCNAIEKEALADGVPIIRKEMGNLLKVLLFVKAAAKNSRSGNGSRLLIYSYE